MKKWLFLLCSLSYGFAMAQDCTQHLLMQKGVKLEYTERWCKRDTFVFRPVARLVFKVEQVKDSAGSTWSTIIRQGFSPSNKNKHYQRKIVLQCDGKRTLFPYGFYTADTLYTKDVYPDLSDYSK